MPLDSIQRFNTTVSLIKIITNFFFFFFKTKIDLLNMEETNEHELDIGTPVLEKILSGIIENVEGIMEPNNFFQKCKPIFFKVVTTEINRRKNPSFIFFSKNGIKSNFLGSEKNKGTLFYGYLKKCQLLLFSCALM